MVHVWTLARKPHIATLNRLHNVTRIRVAISAPTIYLKAAVPTPEVRADGSAHQTKPLKREKPPVAPGGLSSSTEMKTRRIGVVDSMESATAVNTVLSKSKAPRKGAKTAPAVSTKAAFASFNGSAPKSTSPTKKRKPAAPKARVARFEIPRVAPTNQRKAMRWILVAALEAIAEGAPELEPAVSHWRDILHEMQGLRSGRGPARRSFLITLTKAAANRLREFTELFNFTAEDAIACFAGEDIMNLDDGDELQTGKAVMRHKWERLDTLRNQAGQAEGGAQ